MKIVITGTPGTGKSAVAKLLAKKLNYSLIDLNALIKNERLYCGYDRKRKSYIADTKKVQKRITQLAEQFSNVIIEGHLAHILPPKQVDYVFVLRCSPSVLQKRLKRKRWPKAKIDENVEAELIGLIAYEARHQHKRVYELDCTRKSPKSIVKDIEKILKGYNAKYKKKIDWLR